MAVQPSEILHYKSANNPSNDTDTVGGAISANLVGSSIGEIFHTRSANENEADDTLYQYKKSFVKNTNTTTALTNAKAFLKNALDDVGTAGVVSATSTSTDDDNTKKIVVHGEDASNQVQTEDVTLNGTTEVNGSDTFSKVFWIELREVSGGALTNADGDITLEVDGTAIGLIPAGYNCALGIVQIGLVATLDDNGTTTNAVTAPAGISFSKPRTAADALDFANSGTLSAESAQGVWWKQTVEGGVGPAPDLTAVLRIEGDTA